MIPRHIYNLQKGNQLQQQHPQPVQFVNCSCGCIWQDHPQLWCSLQIEPVVDFLVKFK